MDIDVQLDVQRQRDERRVPLEHNDIDGPVGMGLGDGEGSGKRAAIHSLRMFYCLLQAAVFSCFRQRSVQRRNSERTALHKGCRSQLLREIILRNKPLAR